ncbi:hypothetical protein FBZ89_12265 [Nitrospirillum amazonense]|uniref:Lumazine-binding protein n=1 Tax=Nitrospirillum amazonense TaxID=28077 RepID=A0A560EUF3_9PROT|nr:hypothetical protein [Nitrospirillum amazonense]TWB12964.1 hypothetical protein FBZ89_12265 [Nitrospirillum amazonense]
MTLFKKTAFVGIALIPLMALTACGDGGPSESDMQAAYVKYAQEHQEMLADLMHPTSDRSAKPQPRAEVKAKIKKGECKPAQGSTAYVCSFSVTEPVDGKDRTDTAELAFLKAPDGTWAVVGF